jgi:hypothetical protein
MSEHERSRREVWSIQVFLEATAEQAEQAQEAIARALCPDEDHDGYCPVPWTTMRVAFQELEDDERERWQAAFDEDRRRAAEAGHA